MPLFKAILQRFGTNEPILSSDISFRDYSKPWIYKQLNRLCDEGRLVRYEKGIYYIPTMTPFGRSILNPSKVIEMKYISRNGEKMGYYSGITFQNRLRLTTQMSNVIELFTNKETSRVRDVRVGTQRVLLRKARTEITTENADVLSFLELMNDIDPKSLDEEKKAILQRFVADCKIARKDITEYAPFFPDKALRNLVESEVIYSVAQ